MYQEDNKEDPKFEVGECVRISKYKNIFTKGNIPNLSGEDFAFKKNKNTVPWTYVISGLNGEKLGVMFYQTALQKLSQKEFRVEKVAKRKDD